MSIPKTADLRSTVFFLNSLTKTAYWLHRLRPLPGREKGVDFRVRGRENRYPLAEELRAYERSWSASRLEALENVAAQSLTTYTDAVVSQAENQILRSALKGSYWRGVWRWVGGALIYTLLLVASAVGLARSGIDLMTVLDTIIHPR